MVEQKPKEANQEKVEEANKDVNNTKNHEFETVRSPRLPRKKIVQRVLPGSHSFGMW